MTRRLKTVGWYLFDVARSRHTNPARIPVSDFADRYYDRIGRLGRDQQGSEAARPLHPVRLGSTK
jgi:hypothetical protein